MKRFGVILLFVKTLAWGSSGDGTLPLRLTGIAIQISNPRVSFDAEVSVRISERIQRLKSCHRGFSSATGEIIMGFEKYAVKSICKKSEAKQIRIVGENPEGSAVLAGKIIHGSRKVFQGHLKLREERRVRNFKVEMLNIE